MKKIILILAFIPLIIFSQSEGKDKKGFNKWDIGLNGGVNINNPISNNKNFSDVKSTGTLYGLTLVYHFNRFFAFKADFDIENRGWKTDYKSTDGNIDLKNVTQVLDYFDIPAFMHIGFGRKFKVDLNIGPYFGFKIKDKIHSYTPDGEKLSDSETRGEIGIDVKGFDNFDFGLVYGIGFDYQIHRLFSIGFDALLERGMKVINEDGYKNSSIDFDFGINFHLGRKK